MSILERLKNILSKDDSKEDSNIDIVDLSEIEGLITCKKKYITKDVAMKIVALNNGINLISDTIANLPIFLYKKEKGGIKEVIDDYRNNLLNLESSKHCTSFNMKKTLVVDYIINGNAYLDIWKEKGKIKSLINIPESEIIVQDNGSYNRRKLSYSYEYWGMRREFHEVLNMVRNPEGNDIKGIGILKEGRDMLGVADKLDTYSQNIFSNGFFAKGTIETEKIMSKPTRESLQKRIRNFFSGSQNAGKVLILDDGMKYNSLSLNPVDIDFLKQKDFTVNDIARLLKLPPNMIGGSNDGLTYKNVQDTQLQYLQITIEPYLTLIENVFNKYLLTEKEKEEGLFYEFDTKSMLRTTPQKQYEMLGNAVNNKILTPNDARFELNLPPKENGDIFIYENKGELNGLKNV